MRPIKTIVIVIVRPCSTWLELIYQPVFRYPSAWDRLYSTLRCSTETGSDSWPLSALTEASAKEISYFSMVFFQRWLPIILPWSITELSPRNTGIHNLLAMSLSARTCWQWAGPKLHSLLSAHRLISACFLTIESDKHMRLLTRLYGSAFSICTGSVPFILE